MQRVRLQDHVQEKNKKMYPLIDCAYIWESLKLIRQLLKKILDINKHFTVYRNVKGYTLIPSIFPVILIRLKYKKLGLGIIAHLSSYEDSDVGDLVF